LRKPHKQNLLAPPSHNTNLYTGETLDTQNMDLSYDNMNYQPTPLQLAIMQSGGGQLRDRKRDQAVIGEINESTEYFYEYERIRI